MNLTARVKSFFQLQRGPRRLAAPPEAAGRVHPNVKNIVERLSSQGFTALVVGGAVRDLLLGRSPRDFDLVTDARPEQVKRLFSNARIIGRRFRLVHLTYADMTVELATFRATAPRTKGGMIVRDNTYGTPEEDAFRRDFTVNALTYDIIDDEVIDYVDGLADLEAHTLRTIAPPHVSLREDPVRMLRVVRFMVGLSFGVEPELERVMRRMPHTLLKVKRHRLSEETQRFLTRGSAQEIFENLAQFGLLSPMLGLEGYKWFFQDDALRAPLPMLKPYLAGLDRWVGDGREAPSATVALLGLLITLARDEVRTVMLGNTPGRKPGGTGRPDAPHPRKMRDDLHPMLGNWGLLKGQVEPALNILGAMRLLLKQNFKKPGKAPPPGTREAWHLLALLREVLGLAARIPDSAVRQMAALPALPISDHMPRRRHGPQRRRRGGTGTGSGTGSGTAAKGETQPAAPSSSRRRRSRRRRRRAGRDLAQL